MKINRIRFLEVLKSARKFANRRSTLPILTGIRLRLDNKVLHITATDMEKFFSARLDADFGILDCVAPAGKLVSIISSMTSEEVKLFQEQISDSEINLIIYDDHDKIELKCMSGSEYVALPDPEMDLRFNLSYGELIDGVGSVDYAITEKNFSPVLTGVYIRSEGGANSKITFVGTDSFRILEKKIDRSSKEFKMIIPKSTLTPVLQNLRKIIKDGNNTISVYSSDTMVRFYYEYEGIVVNCGGILIQGNYPDYEREEIMPTSFNGMITVNKHLLRLAILKVGIFTKDINLFTGFHLEGEELKLSSGKTDSGTIETKIRAVGDYNVEFALNGGYLLQFIKNIPSDEIRFRLVDSQKPMIINSEGEKNLTYIVRPLISN